MSRCCMCPSVNKLHVYMSTEALKILPVVYVMETKLLNNSLQKNVSFKRNNPFISGSTWVINKYKMNYGICEVAESR